MTSTDPARSETVSTPDISVAIDLTVEKPTTLKPVIDAIPAHCYERSTSRALMLVGRDLVFYAVALTGLAMTNNPLLLVPLWLLAGLSVAGLFVLGHDAAHNAFVDSKKLNEVLARLTMLPSLHATEPWVFGHNRVHHGHTLREGMDFVWHPLTADQYQELSTIKKLRHRLEWSWAGAGAYYAREVWFNKMVRFTPPERYAKKMRQDQALVAAFAGLTLAAMVATSGVGGLWLWAKMIVVPFLLFCQTIGWVVYMHHIAPEIRWWKRRDWNRYRGQVEGTTVMWGPPGWDLFFHWIMVHLPHHVDMRIPCYHLPEAARAIAEAFPGEVAERKISLRSYLRSTKNCKVHDFETGVWSTYPA